MMRHLTVFGRGAIRFFRKVSPPLITPLAIQAPRILKPLLMTTGGFYLHNSYHAYALCQTLTEETEQSVVQKPQTQPSLLQRFAEIFLSTLRFFHLLFIFSPVLLTLPLKMFDSTKDLWYDMFVNCVARAGVVWIKAFQYLSHRRDMIGEDMANKFVRLRENAPTHSFKQTNQNFRNEFGKNIDEVFDSFEREPIASGSVSQVYQAVYKGQKVAVKVRHPGVQNNIERDLNLLFGFSRFFSLFSKRFQIPVGESSLKRTLVDQIDFNIEARNLNIFNEMFRNNKKVKFPVAIEGGSGSSVLMESFVEGTPITYYEKNQHLLNKVIARIGATTFFEMLMKNNFIHADCHGGNIMVTIKERSNGILFNIKDMAKRIYNAVEQRLVSLTFSSKLFKDLYVESKKEEEQSMRLERELKQDVQVTLIDVGMVIELDQSDRRNFVSFIQSFLMQQPEQCAQMIYSLSLHGGQKIINESLDKYREYYDSLRKLFSVIEGTEIQKVDGLVLFRGMLDLIRQSRMKLDGQFATLITNMLVLEAIAKDLHPDINILKCAIPYFRAN